MKKAENGRNCSAGWISVIASINQSVPTSDNQKTASDSLSCEHGASDKEGEEEKREEVLSFQLFPMASIRAMGELKHFVSKA
jgi:hypothetical protein